MYRITGTLQDGREIFYENPNLEEANVWLSNQLLKPNRRVEDYIGPIDVTAEYQAKEAERAELDGDFGELKSTVLSKINDGTLFSSLSNAEKKVIKTLVRLIRR